MSKVKKEKSTMVTNWMTSPQGSRCGFGWSAAALVREHQPVSKILRMFPQDETYKQIEPALQANDWAALLAAAHTLKGVAGIWVDSSVKRPFGYCGLAAGGAICGSCGLLCKDTGRRYGIYRNHPVTGGGIMLCWRTKRL